MRARLKLLLAAIVLPFTFAFPVKAGPPTLGRVSVPLTFVSNAGQFPKQYAFVAQTEGIKTMLLLEGADILLPTENSRGGRVAFRLVGESQTAFVSGIEPLAGVSNYFHGTDPSRWVMGARQYGKVKVGGIYPGIDMVYHPNGNQLEDDFILAPGAKASKISFRLGGADNLSISGQGDLVILCGSAKLIFKQPIAFQSIGSKRKDVKAQYQLRPDGTVAFRIGRYDHSRELVIDPILVFSTYLGGSNADFVSSVTTDLAGNIYVVGTTGSTDFPTKNSIKSACPDCLGTSQDAFVTELDPSGSKLIFSTYLGGSSREMGGSILIAPNGNVVVSGLSASTDFPVAGNTIPHPCQTNNECYFLASLSPDGSKLINSGIVGGTQANLRFDPIPEADEAALAPIAVDHNNNVYLTGSSWDPNFQFISGTLNPNPPAYPSSFLFVIKIDATGHLIFSTAITGNAPVDLSTTSNIFGPNAIMVDGSGQVTIAGTAGPGLPTTAGALQGTFANAVGPNATQGFLLQMNAAATALNFATYLPGTDYANAMAVDATGNLYLAGTTSENNLPASANAFQKTLSVGDRCNCYSGYVMKLDRQRQSVLAATYFYGSNSTGTSLNGIAVDSHTNIFVGGMTGAANFPLVDPIVTRLLFTNIDSAPVIGQLSPDMSTLLFSSFMNGADKGGLAGGTFEGVTVDAQDHPIVVGSTVANEFPTTPNSFQPQSPSFPVQGAHGFISKLDMTIAAPSICLDTWDINFLGVRAKTTGTQTLTVTNCGTAPLHFLNVQSTVPFVTGKSTCVGIAPGGTCTVQISCTPPAVIGFGGTLTLIDDAAVPTILNFIGKGGGSIVVASPGNIDFGALPVGTTGALATLYLQNNGGDPPVLIQNLSLSGSDFGIVSQVCNNPTECVVVLSFTPLAPGIRTGVLLATTNDPVNPQITINISGTGTSSYGTPIIASMNPLNYEIGNVNLKITLTGENFAPASIIRVNGQPQKTTYLGFNSLSAVVDSSLAGNIGELQVTVLNPAPGGGESNPMPLPVYKALNIVAASIASVPATNSIYASIFASAPNNPNTVLPINPATGTFGTPIPIGTEPRALAASDDGLYLYVAVQGDQVVKRISLKTNTIERTFAFPPAQNIGDPPFMVNDLHVVPGSPKSFVLALSGMVAAYDDNGLLNALRFDLVSFTFLGPNTLYALPLSYQNSFFGIITLDAQGLHYTQPSANMVDPPITGSAVIGTDGTRLYTSSGQIWDVATQEFVGNFPSGNFMNYNDQGTVLVDSVLGQTFLLGMQNFDLPSDSIPTVLFAYNNQTQQVTGKFSFGQFSYPLITSLSRWGSNGLAFIGGQRGVEQEVFLLSSSIVASQTSAQASLSATSLDFGQWANGTSSSIQTLTLTNSGNDTLRISGINVTGEFSETTSCGPSLPARQSCNIMLTFSPTVTGARNGILTIADNATGNTQIVLLSGTSTTPVLTVSPANGGSVNVTVNKGETATYQLSVVGSGNMQGTVALSCTGVPANLTCLVTPATVNLASGSANFSVSVSPVNGAIVSIQKEPEFFHIRFNLFGLLVIAMVFLIINMTWNLRKPLSVPTIVFAVAFALLLAGCGAGGGSSVVSTPITPPTTTSTTYTFAVAATAGQVSTSQTLTLKVLQ